jgi:hypothetical protein
VKIKYIAQQQDKGCVIACIAMVLGRDYWKVAKDFHVDLERKGINMRLAQEYLCDHGLSVIEKTAYGYPDVTRSNKRMLIPFAPVHIVFIQQYADLAFNHAYVMTRNGRMLDPGNRERTDPKVDYCVVGVLGCYKD